MPPVPRSPALDALYIAFTAVCLYNIVELVVLIFSVFKKYQGFYFWSLLVASVGIVPGTLTWLLSLFNHEINEYVAVGITTVSFWCMVTGQSVVLWSRLHLVCRNHRILRGVLWMIVVDAIVHQVPTSVLGVLTRTKFRTDTNDRAFEIAESIQVVGFFIQEFIISSIYIYETALILQFDHKNPRSLHPRRQKVLNQLIAVNITVIAMDIILITVQFSGYFYIQASLKPMIYSMKLKLEFVVLSRLVKVVDQSSAEIFLRAPSTSSDVVRNNTNPPLLFPIKSESNANIVSPPSRASPLSISLEILPRKLQRLERCFFLPLESFFYLY